MTAPLDLFDFDRYLARVGLGRGALTSCAPRSCELLKRIMWAQATHIPWENLATIDPSRRRVFHPSSAAGIEEAERDVPTKLRTSIDPNDIFHKLVAMQRGGYCYEHNLLLARALREVDFEVDLIAARGVNRAVSSIEGGHPLAPSTHGGWYASTSPYHRQPHLRLAALMTEDGRVSLVNDVLTVRRGGQIVSEDRLATEAELEAALLQHFGIRSIELDASA